MFWNILLFLFFMFAPAALASDVSVSFVSGATSGTVNTQFDVQVKLTAATAGTYYVKADNGSSCTIDMLYESNNSWSNGCYLGTNVMKQMVINSDGGSTEETLRLRATGSSGSYTLYAYVYDSGRNLLSTSSAYSITINSAPTSTPTSTPTLTPTPTSAVTSTPTPTPTIKTTPTPTETPAIEPTSTPEPTVEPEAIQTVAGNLIESDSSKKTKSSVSLPVIFIALGLLMFIVPIFGPKILDKIKSERRKRPPIEPPKFQTPISTTQVPSVGEDPTISNFQ